MKTSLRFKSFSSGSSGNCYFLGIFDGHRKCEAGILIDAGVSLRRLKNELASEGLCFDDFSAILITHDHNDHIHSLGSYCKKLGKPVWLTPALRKSLSVHWMTGEYLAGVVRTLDYDGWNEIVPGRIRAKCFIMPHDATETVGFCIEFDGERYVHITDAGKMTPEALEYCKSAPTVTIEANYDPEMLANGPYPPELQDRIRGGHGHISNFECADAVAEFVGEGTRNIFLCHLSEHNNTPALALETVKESLQVAAGNEVEVRLIALPHRTPSPLFEL
ncbi:MAG: MBL fold metallo-hydrolase [Bacteroidales bacterium]|nr:MBL fold metallo-hydrolase [Bacteroidales bacterium]